MGKMLLYGAEIINEGRSFYGYLKIEGERILSVSEGDVPEEVLLEYSSEEIFDLHGRWLVPGVIDDQVHFREPGAEHKGNIFTESRAAAAGGTTSYMDMPNTNPQTVSLEAWENKMNIAVRSSAVNYAFFVGATNDNYKELDKFDFSRIPGIKVFLGSSTGNMLVNSDEALDSIFQQRKIVAVHSESEDIIKRNVSEIAAEYGAEDVPYEIHPVIRSEEACVSSTEKALRRAEKFNTRLHILHVSTAKEVEMIREAKNKGYNITAEACLPHIIFSDDDYPKLGAGIKCNPAVKKDSDRTAIREGIKQRVIDIIATDHAPHLLSEKQGGALKAASGLPGVQYSLLAILGLCKKGLWRREDVVEYMCHRPADLFGIKERGYIREGYFADLVVVNPAKHTSVSSSDIISRCGWSPFEGTQFPFEVEMTIVNGTPVWREGNIISSNGLPLEFNS